MKIFSKGLVLINILFFLTSCASGPTFENLKSSIPALSPDSGRIYIYRVEQTASLYRPDILLNGEKIGEAQAGGFFYVDRDAGNYNIVISDDEVDRKISFAVQKNQTRYVSIKIFMGLIEGYFYPELVDEQEGLENLKYCRYSQKISETTNQTFPKETPSS